MTVKLLQPLTWAECQRTRLWRNDPLVMPILRTGFKTAEEQTQFYFRVICPRPLQRFINRWLGDEHEYYAVEVDGEFAGMAGLTYIKRSRFGRCGETEISLVLGPKFRGKGVGTAAVDLLLAEAQKRQLDVIGECYATGNLRFWTSQILKRPALMTWRWTCGS